MNAAVDTVLVVGDDERASVPDVVAEALAAEGLHLLRVGEEGFAEALGRLLALGQGPSVVVVGPSTAAPVAAARHAHRLSASVQIVFLAGAEAAERLRHDLMRAPMIGTHWTIASPGAAALAGVLSDAALATRRRTSARATIDRLNTWLSARTRDDADPSRRLVVSNHHLASILEFAADAILSLDREDAIATWNAGASRLFGYEQVDVLGRSVALLADPGNVGELIALVRRAWSGDAARSHELACRREDGSRFVAEVTLAPVRDETERIVAVSAIARDVTERTRYEAEIEALNAELGRRIEAVNEANAALRAALEMLEASRRELLELNEALEQQATTDALTGLRNRIVFQNSLLEMIAVAERQRTPLSVLVIDVDHFKRVNDTRGHQEGDRALRAIALALRADTREQDVVARYGGEEFAVLLPNTDLAAAVVVGEHIRAACARVVDIEPPLTVSIGAAEYLPGDTDVTLIGRADEALYVSKARGRNRVTAAESSAST